MDASQLLNRPMLDGDLVEIGADPWARALRQLVAEYAGEGLAVVNGTLALSNLLEGPARMLTCHPYRLWEYASLFRVLGDSFRGLRFLDVGGAASPLPFLLAEGGARGVALERQPLLVELCNHAARTRGLDLRAECADAAVGIGLEAEFDLVACISVIEHVPSAARPSLLRHAARALRPGGLLYLTFDYGTHVARAPYGYGPADSLDEALPDLEPLCDALLATGLCFLGNDPLQLPEEVRVRKTAPGHVATARRMALNRPPYDGETPWSEVGRYLGRRLLGLGRTRPTRYASHNFFRLFLRRRG